MSSCRVVIADDHMVVREGLRTVLERQVPCTVVGEATTGAEALTLVRQLQPTILVTDMVMPGMNGLEVVHQVQLIVPAPRVVVFSMHADEGYVRDALRAGAIGYVLKESRADDLVMAIQYAAEGRRYVSPILSERILGRYAEAPSSTSFDPYEQLTERERTVLVLLARGQTAIEIAAQLGLSPRTVESYRSSLMHKLDLRTIADLVLYAVRRGLIALDA